MINPPKKRRPPKHNKNASSAPKKSIPFLFLIASTTPQKLVEYGAILNHLFPGCVVRSLSDFEIFHSAVEDGDTLEKNLDKKRGEVKKTVDALRHSGKNHALFEKKLENYGLFFEDGKKEITKRTIALVDDTTVAIPTDIWKCMLPVIQEHVVPDACKASPCNEKELTGYTSITDFGPIVAAMGHKKFWNLLNQTAENLPQHQGKRIKVYNRVSCSFSRLSDGAEAPYEAVKANVPLYVARPGEEITTSRIPTSDDFLCPPNTPDIPMGKQYGEYLLGESMRRVLCGKLCDKLSLSSSSVSESPKRKKTPALQAAAKETLERKKRRVAVFTSDDEKAVVPEIEFKDCCINPVVLPSKGASFDALNREKGETLEKTLAMNFSFGHADVLLFPPFDKTNEKLRNNYGLMLRSAFVAKAVDPMYHHASLIVMNKDGCYDDVLRSHEDYALGYNKEILRKPVFEINLPAGDNIVKTDGISHIPFFYADVIEGKDPKNLTTALHDILSFRQKTYHRLETGKVRAASTSGTTPPDNICMVTVFASAGSDKLGPNVMGKELGRFLGKNGFGLCTGGGDQHLMVAPVNGYNETRKEGASHLACFSTYDIVHAETAHGDLPPCDQWGLYEGIGDRLKALTKSPILVSIGGGDGTGQETAYTYLLKKYSEDDADKNKTLVFIGSDRPMRSEIKSILGEEKFNRLDKNPYALQNEGVFLFQNLGDAKPVLLDARKRLGKDPTPDATAARKNVARKTPPAQQLAA